MIDPEIWQSEDFSKLSLLARLIFIGLFSNADDYGRGRAKPVYIRSLVFPYDDNIKVQDVEKALKEIKAIMSIVFYESNENQYYSLVNWDKWQRVDKPQKSKIPPPPDSENDSRLIPESFSTDSRTIPEQASTDSRTIPEQFLPKRKERKGREYKENIKEKEGEQKGSVPAAVDPDLLLVMGTYQEKINPMASGEVLAGLREYLGVMHPEVILRAFDIALDERKPTWSYINGILRAWKAKGIVTLLDLQHAQDEFERRKQESKAREGPKTPSEILREKIEAGDFDDP
jgi:DnaD/phage-associated family protein